MSESKKTIYWISGILGCAIILTGGVVAQDLGFIEHVSHFHFDPEAIRERAERDELRRLEREESIREWVRDVESAWRDNDGVYSNDVDHDCNRDR